jgi:putative hydrolase
VAEAAKDRLPGWSALAETMRRRRASGGPAEQTFATLVGLQLRPRRLRDAATVWAAMGQQHGGADRDRLWAHPDLLPTSDDLDEPLDFVARQGLDDELAALTADDAERPADSAESPDAPDAADEPEEDGKG